MDAKSSCRALLLAVAALLGSGAAIAQTTPDAGHTRVSLPVDWSYTHTIYSKDRTPDEEAAKPNDKRYIYSRKLHSNTRSAASVGVGGSSSNGIGKDVRLNGGFLGEDREQPANPAHVDWSFSLGAGYVAPGMYPAKFSFDINAPVTTANCTGSTGTPEYGFPDFVVYGLDVPGVTGGQGNLVALDNLYTGVNGGGTANGLCPGTGPIVYWSYNTTTASGGKITTSPVLSEDGQQVAFLESGGSTTYLHILNWNAGDGTSNGDAVHAVAPSTVWAGASATASVSDTVSSVTLTNAGSGYSTAPTVTISGGNGTGATATSTLNAGVTGVNISTQGTGYNSAPTVTFANPTGQGGTLATGTANVTNGVTSYTVTAGGSYTTTPTVSVAAPGNGGTTATGTAVVSTGVTSIAVTNGGTGYTSAPIVVYSGSGGGAATANLSQGVGSYTLGSGGSGYTSAPTVSVTGGGGTGATATATISGSVQSVNLTAAGSGYQSAPTVVFSGSGGAAATATIAGPVSALTLTGTGAGYTSAPTVTISAPASGTTATASANMSTITSVSSVTFTNHGSYNTYGFFYPSVTFGCSTTGCVQNTPATGTVVDGNSAAACGTALTGNNVCLASITITNAGSFTLTGGSIVMTVNTNFATTNTAAVCTVNTSSSEVVSSLALTSGGSGYTANPTVTITGGGATTNATATATINGTVQSVTLTNGGTYSTAPTVSFTGGSGTGAAASETFSAAVTAVNDTAIGTGYTSAPTVTLTGGGAGSGAAATANLTGIVGSITVTTPGVYASTPTITFNNTGTGGTGAAATASTSKYVSSITVTNAGNNYTAVPTVTFSGTGGAAATANLGGVVSSVTVTSAGSGYTAVPTVTFTSNGSGSGATGTATIAGSIASVTIGNAGSGYTGTPTVTFGAGGGGTGAAGTVNTQDGVSAITVVGGGSGYTAAPVVTITGGGTSASGATATANISAGGVVTSITITGNGTGYTSAPTVTVAGPAGCSGTSSCMVNVAVGANHITLSSPYYDYDTDVLYFGDDQGVLYSVSPVFVGTATTGGNATPVVTKMQVGTTSGQTMLTGPVEDPQSGNVFVGAADGKVYAVPYPLNSAAASSMAVGQGTGSCGSGVVYSGGITDPVIIDDSVNALYAYTQNAATTISSANHAVVTQAATGAPGTTLFGSRVNNLSTGSGAFCGSNPASTGASSVNVHAPAFDNNYYNGTGVGHLFVCNNSTSTPAAMYAITFSNGVMNNAVDPTLGVSFATLASSDYAECAPITEIFQPGSDGGPDGTDYMLLGIGRIAGGTGAFGAAVGQGYSVTSSYTMTAGIGHSVNTYPAAQDGTSGIVVDNISPAAQASSMYFTTEAVGTTADPVCGTGKYCAVKLTQAGLQ